MNVNSSSSNTQTSEATISDTGTASATTGIGRQISSYTYPTMALREVRNYTQVLAGKIKTILDAAIQDPRQNKAAKDIAHQAIWGLYDEVRAWTDGQTSGLGSPFPFGGSDVPMSL